MVEAMEQDIKSAPKTFWQTVQQLRRGRRNPGHTVFHVGGELLAPSESIVQGWKEYVKDLLNPTKMHTKEDTELKDLG